MRIAQIVLPGLSQYETKHQRADRAALAERHELVDDVREADVAHVYSSAPLPRADFVRFQKEGGPNRRTRPAASCTSPAV